nr:MAG TPA: hypothetical protein [Caudoviricetes sp.]
MSTKQKEETPAELTTPASHPPKFTVKRLRRDCFSLFGVTTSTYDGATYKLTGEHSVAEMRAIIEKWQNQGVFDPKKTKKEVK